MCHLKRANFHHCRTFNFSFSWFFPFVANTRLFRQCVYAGASVCVRKCATVKLCEQVLIDWVDYLGILFVFALLLLLLLYDFVSIFQKKNKPSSQTNVAISFCFPTFQICWHFIDFDSIIIFFRCLQHYRWAEKNKDKNKTYYITNDIDDIITLIPRHLKNKKEKHKLYTSPRIRTKRNTLSINPYMIIKTTWSCLVHSTFLGVIDSLSFLLRYYNQ